MNARPAGTLPTPLEETVDPERAWPLRSVALPTAWSCTGCGARFGGLEPVPMRCPRAAPDDDVDHVVRRTIDPHRARFPTGEEPNPFVRYRGLFHAWHLGRAIGWSDGAYIDLVQGLDEAVARIDGRGFRVTPLGVADALAAALAMEPATILVKDETHNVSGSHKARHLFGTALELELRAAARHGAAAQRREGPDGLGIGPLAIASCGNAALAAAVIARAWGRDLRVFIPPDADPAVVDRLRVLGASVTVAYRRTGVGGDPAYALLREALEQGAVPFTCQGNENGFAIEGGLTLGAELVSQLVDTDRDVDHVIVQVGGGALAASTIQALREAVDLGVLNRLPRIHAVQTHGGYPLVRAHARVARHLLDRPLDATLPPTVGPWDLADHLREIAATPAGAAALDELPRHRSTWMWPWETTPESIAHGILDDETYDWYAVVRGLVESGGESVVVDEATLRLANDLARRTTGIDVDHTGSAGLAGLIDLRRRGAIAPDDRVAVLFTGVRRSSPIAAITAQLDGDRA
jgi:threonine synthase